MKTLDEKAYQAYIRSIDMKIDRIKKEINELPDLEKVRKMTFEEWKTWQNKKIQLTSIKFHER